jgi:NADPH-dependent 2,4-dienoyl-CoA reductase/sulfur reductase-like enzyme
MYAVIAERLRNRRAVHFRRLNVESPQLSGGDMSRPPRIAIIGGGIGGLAAALALERRGAETVVC